MHGVLVLEPIQAVERFRTAGIGMSHARAIQLGFEPADELLLGRLVRPRHPRRRHQASVELAHDLLPDIGVFADGRHIEAVECQPASPEPRVMTAEAVLIEKGAV